MSCEMSGYRYWDGFSASREAMPERLKSGGGSALTRKRFPPQNVHMVVVHLQSPLRQPSIEVKCHHPRCRPVYKVDLIRVRVLYLCQIHICNAGCCTIIQSILMLGCGNVSSMIWPEAIAQN